MRYGLAFCPPKAGLKFKRMLRKKLFIFDPSLKDKQGHHYSLTYKVAAAAVSMAWDVHWVVHKDFEKSQEPDFTVTPIFSCSMYEIDASEVSHQLDELGQWLDRQTFCDGDVFFVHTLYGQLAKSFFGLLQNNRLPSGVSVHLCTPYRASFMPDGLEASELIDMLDQLVTSDEPRFYLYGETEALSAEYEDLLGRRIGTLQLPADVPIKDKRRRHESRENISAPWRLRLAYLGPARAEKGFNLLPALVRDLLLRGEQSKAIDFEFFIQTTPQIKGFDPALTDALSELEALESEFSSLITLHAPNMSSAEYQRVLDWSDMVIMVYDQQKYVVRGTGIAVDAVANGLGIAAFANTAPSKYVTRGGGCVAESLDGLADGLRRIHADPAAMFAGAAAQKREYLNKNSPRKYLAKMLRGESLCGLLPSNLLGYQPVDREVDLR